MEEFLFRVRRARMLMSINTLDKSLSSAIRAAVLYAPLKAGGVTSSFHTTIEFFYCQHPFLPRVVEYRRLWLSEGGDFQEFSR